MTRRRDEFTSFGKDAGGAAQADQVSGKSAGAASALLTVSPGVPTLTIGGSGSALARASLRLSSRTSSRLSSVAIVSAVPLPTAPTLNYGTPPQGTEGVAYTLTPALTGAGAIVTLASGTLPPGLSLAPGTGVISGTPTAPATYSNIVLRATNAGGSVDDTIDITIVSGMPALYKVAADVPSADSAVWVDVKSVVLAANSTYDLESILSVTAAGSDTFVGVQLRYADLPAGASIFTITEYSSIVSAAYVMRSQASVGADIFLAPDSAGFGEEQPVNVRSIIVTGDAGGAMKLQAKTETNTREVNVKAGSGLVLRGSPLLTRIAGSDLTNDDDTAWVDIFSMPVEADSTTVFEFLLHYAAAATTTGIALRITGIPAGAEIQFMSRGRTNTVPSWLVTTRTDDAAVTQLLTPTTGENHAYKGVLAVRTAGTAGTIKLQFRSSVDTSLVTVRIGSTMVERPDAVLTAADVSVSSATVGVQVFDWDLEADKHYVITNHAAVVSAADATGYQRAVQDSAAVDSHLFCIFAPRGPTTFNNAVRRDETKFGVAAGETDGVGATDWIIVDTDGAGGTLSYDGYSENTNQVTFKKNSITILEEVALQ